MAYQTHSCSTLFVTWDTFNIQNRNISLQDFLNKAPKRKGHSKEINFNSESEAFFS